MTAGNVNTNILAAYPRGSGIISSFKTKNIIEELKEELPANMPACAAVAWVHDLSCGGCLFEFWHIRTRVNHKIKDICIRPTQHMHRKQRYDLPSRRGQMLRGHQVEEGCCSGKCESNPTTKISGVWSYASCDAAGPSLSALKKVKATQAGKRSATAWLTDDSSLFIVPKSEMNCAKLYRV